MQPQHVSHGPNVCLQININVLVETKLQRGAKEMNSTHLPPLPKEGESGPQVCNTVRLYLAVLDDLSPEQVTLLFKHVETCSTCSEEFQLMNGATHRSEERRVGKRSRC